MKDGFPLKSRLRTLSHLRVAVRGDLDHHHADVWRKSFRAPPQVPGLCSLKTTIVQRDVPALLDRPDDEGYMRRGWRRRRQPCGPGAQLTHLRPHNPAIALGPPTLNGATACGANMPSSEAFETRDRMSRSMLFPSSTSIPVAERSRYITVDSTITGRALGA
ncbi:hypothetical protein MES4922_380028 [Mesorhizobium ventifaucium]|uniref:Uncharacterized protein n=1 Tax=Mesorhizobium ventifaucium TaxID=666020 RepID=A0ABN8K3R0_9HYPH|nr:hypothetical protein MES4922_380028 [Mesorhizobium ventifaucium]